MQWIFVAFLAASLVHMGEEYFFPGGFIDFMRRLNPRFAAELTPSVAVTINGAQLLLCLATIAVGERFLIFSLSVAALLFINAWMHLLGCIRVRGYAPGLITGVLLYLPLSIYAYSSYIGSGGLTLSGAIIAGVLGLLYQAVPLSYFGLASALRRG